MKKPKAEQVEQPVEETAQSTQEPQEQVPAAEAPAPTELELAQTALTQEHDQYLRLAAEYDNFRKRSQREKDGIYQDAAAATIRKFLPVYDDLLRALQTETTDEAYKKGVEMTFNGLLKILEGLGVAPFGAVGERFDPNLHNAVMHVEDETLEENVITELFQTGFAQGERVIRFAMVKVAN